MARWPRGSIEPASPVFSQPSARERVARGFVLLVVALEHARSAHLHLAAVADAHLGARQRAPHRIRIGLAVDLPGDERAGFRGAVDLLQIDAERAKEAERVGAQRSAARQAPARASQAELVAHRAIDDELAEQIGEPGAERDRLGVLLQQLTPHGDIAKIAVDRPLEPRCVGSPHLQRGQHVLPNSRRPEQGAGAKLAQVALHCLRAFRAVAGRSRNKAGAEREDGIAHPGHRQVAEPVVTALDRLHRDKAFRHGDQVAMRQQRSLGATGCAGGVGHQRHVIRPALGQFRLVVGWGWPPERPCPAPPPRRTT